MGTMPAATAAADPPLEPPGVLEPLEKGLPANYGWPGNQRELEQAVRRILLTGRYAGELPFAPLSGEESLLAQLRAGELTAEDLLRRYCALLYARFGTYTEVSTRTGLDWRTAKKHAEAVKPG